MGHFHSELDQLQRHSSEDGGSMDLWNVSILPQHYTVSQPKTWISGFRDSHFFNIWSISADNISVALHSFIQLFYTVSTAEIMQRW